MAQNKPSRWSRRTGTTVKKIVLKSEHAALKAAKEISKQAIKASPGLKNKIEKDSLRWSAYDSSARTHAHQEELKKLGIETEKVRSRMFVPKNSKFKKPKADDYFRSELRIPTKDYYLDKRTGAKEALSDQD